MTTSRAPKPFPPSLWAATAVPRREFPPLAGEVRTKSVIIGAGFVGLSAALHLAEAGHDAVVIEANAVGWGASGRNGAQAIPGLKFDPDTLEEMFGPNLGPRVVRTAGNTTNYLFEVISKFGIPCDARQKGWIQPAHSPTALALVQRRAKQWMARGVNAKLLDAAEVKKLIGAEGYLGGWLDPRGGGIQPLSYARGLANAAVARGARIFEATPALKLEQHGTGWKVTTPAGSVVAEKLLIATNAYTDDLWPGLRQSLVPAVSVQIATDPLPSDIRKSILPQEHYASDTLRLLRYYHVDVHGRFILGTRGPLYDDVSFDDAKPNLRHVQEMFPQLAGIPFSFVWSGRVAMTPDHLQHMHVLAPNAFAAVGCVGRGVALTTTTGRFLADLAQGVPPEAIDFPITPVKSLPLHAFTPLAVWYLTQYYRLRDRFV